MLKGKKKYSLEQIKEIFIKIHGDKYDYSLFTEYQNTKKYIDIICKKHKKIFHQQIAMHMIGQGCPECKKETLSKLHKPDLCEILLKFKNTHGDLYDYTNITEYNGCDEIVKIKCKKHGIFYQSSKNHIKGQGCPYCYNEIRHIYQCSNLNDFSNKAKMLYGDLYDYSKGVYYNSKTEIEIICPIHGSFFKKPGNHLSGEGCPFCFSSKGEKKYFQY